MPEQGKNHLDNNDSARMVIGLSTPQEKSTIAGEWVSALRKARNPCAGTAAVMSLSSGLEPEALKLFQRRLERQGSGGIPPAPANIPEQLWARRVMQLSRTTHIRALRPFGSRHQQNHATIGSR